MTIVFSVETWDQIKVEGATLIELHWREVAVNQNEIALEPDWAKYEEYAAAGALLCIAVRDEGKLVGYHVSIITPLLHYKSIIAGITDIYWIRPEYRQGSTGVRLFREVETASRARGVKLLVSASKRHLDLSPIFKRLNYQAVETVYKKVLR